MDQRRRVMSNQRNNQSLSGVFIGLGVLLMVLGVLLFVGRAVGFDLGRFAWPFFVIVPGLAVFVSEFLSIMGGYEAFPVQGVLAALGIILSAMYLLYMLARVIFGPIERPQYEGISDAGPGEMAAIVPLATLLLVLGIFPALLISVQRPAVEAILSAIGGS